MDMDANITRRGLLALAGFAALGIAGCATDARIAVDDAAVADTDATSEHVEAVIGVMRGELGNTDGTAYEDALLEAGGELCGGERGLWCVTFLWWAFREAGCAAAFLDGEAEGWPERQWDWFDAHGQTFDADDEAPVAGDLYYQLLEPKYRFEGCGDVSHGEFVIGWDVDARTVTCISANPIVELHEHNVDEERANGQYVGFARPAWERVDA